VHFSLEIWQLVDNNFNDFAENQLTKFCAVFKVNIYKAAATPNALKTDRYQ